MLGGCGSAVMVQVVRCLLVQRKVWLCNMLAEMLVEGEGNAGRVRAVSQGDARVGMAGRRAAEGAGEGAAVRWEPWGGRKSRATAWRAHHLLTGVKAGSSSARWEGGRAVFTQLRLSVLGTKPPRS